MSYYVDLDYWISGYAEGDPIGAAAAVASMSSVSASPVAVLSGSALAASISTPASTATRIRRALSNPIGASHVTSVGYRSREVAATAASTLDTNASSQAVYISGTNIATSASAAVTPARVQSTSAAYASSSIATASAIYKWEPNAITGETWSLQPAASGSWVMQSTPSEGWHPQTSGDEAWQGAQAVSEIWSDA